MPVTTRDIRDKVFRNSGRGYNKDDVDSFLDEIIDEMNLLCNKIDALELRMEAEQAKMKSISAASQSAEQIILDAKAYSQKMVKEAKELAESIVNDAKLKSEQMLKSIHESREHYSAEPWHGYPGFEDDLQAIAGQVQGTMAEANTPKQQVQAKRPDGFSFDDLDFEKDLSSSKENIREALLTDLGMESKSDGITSQTDYTVAPPSAAENITKINETPGEQYRNTSIAQDDYYNLLYGPGPISKLDISEIKKTNAASAQYEKQEMARAESPKATEQEDIRRVLQSSKREPIPFPGASAEMQENRERPHSYTRASANAGPNDNIENTLHRRKPVDIYNEEPEDIVNNKAAKSNIHFALMPLEIEERRPLQRYSTNLDSVAHSRDDNDPGYASEKYRNKK